MISVWAKVAFGVAEVAVLPWATEAWARPSAPGDESLRPFSLDWLRTLLPAERDGAKLDEAKEALGEGERALAEGRPGAAAESLERVELLAPREYKLNMRAGLRLADAYEATGDVEGRGRIGRRTWWWGRGVRWPGWYLIAYLSFRSAYFSARRSRRGDTAGQRGRNSAPTVALVDGGDDDDDDDDVGTSVGLREAALVLVIWGTLITLLFTYGLPDY